MSALVPREGRNDGS